MIEHAQRQQIHHDIQSAVGAGARFNRACRTIGLHPRTLKRWRSQQPISHDSSYPESRPHPQIATDQRPKASHPKPAHALSKQEQQAILQTCN